MKRVLLICPRFFDYYKAICAELEQMGYEVDWFDDMPNKYPFVRALGRINTNWIQPFARVYFDRMMAQVGEKRYDVVILMRGMCFCYDEEMMRQLKANQGSAQFVLYQWDSLRNMQDTPWIWSLFDRCYSFEPGDVKREPKLSLLPLFYTRDYQNVGQQAAQPEWDYFYYGTAHPKKLTYINRMAKLLQEKGLRVNVGHFLPSKLKYYYHKLHDRRAYRGYRFSDFTTTKLSMAEMAQAVANAKCVLDSPQGGQYGLTMRSIECLGAKRKLITANEDIRNYDFYNENNIYVFGGTLDFDHPFFHTDYEAVEEEVYQRYSLRSWLEVMLGEKEEVYRK